MKILRSYILKEVTGPLITSLAVFTFVLLIGNMFKLADLLVNKGVDVQDVLKLFIYLIPYILSYTTPMAILTATMLCFGRLASDNEVTAMKASGISLYGIGLPVIVAAFIISLASVYLNDRVLPQSHFASYKLIKEVGMKKPTAYLEAGTFIKSFKGYILFIHSINGDNLRDVRIYQLQDNGPARTIVAQSGTIKTFPEKNLVELKLNNGTLDEPNPDNPKIFYKLNFKTYNMKLNLAENFSKYDVEKKPKDMTIREIREEIARLKNNNIDTVPLLAEIHRKIAMAFSGFVFVLVGLPVAINTKRREKSVGFGMSLIILITYYLLFIGGQALALRHIVTPIIGLWLANIIYFILGSTLMFMAVEK
ncbi:MAG: LptF/LptG family permease [Candidatus Omnitrophota bacterium]